MKDTNQVPEDLHFKKLSPFPHDLPTAGLHFGRAGTEGERRDGRSGLRGRERPTQLKQDALARSMGEEQ